VRIEAASVAGSDDKESEDWLSATAELIVVLDGQTARTDTGCSHGVAWYTAHLGAALVTAATDPGTPLADALAAAIEATGRLHPDCDLTSPATPGAAVAVVRLGPHIDYLVLGDVTIALDTGKRVQVIVDDRVEHTAVPERRYVDRFPIGSPEKAEGLIRMKHAELAARNTTGGFWVAAADPNAARHAITGSIDAAQVKRFAVLTDGAARIVKPFRALRWPGLLTLLDSAGPTALIQRVRALEAADPLGKKWPRNKQSDDASVVYVALTERHTARRFIRTKSGKRQARWRRRRR